MTFGLRSVGLLALLGLIMQAPALAQCVSLTTAGSASSQNFDTLANTGTTNNLTITGWFLTETGGGARDNEQYAQTPAEATPATPTATARQPTERALGAAASWHA
jgi:hypothetical protein